MIRDRARPLLILIKPSYERRHVRIVDDPWPRFDLGQIVARRLE
jgi:hypothetical protein